MGKGQPLIFLNALPETHAGKAARAQGYHRLDGLKAGVERIRPWVNEGQDAM